MGGETRLRWRTRKAVQLEPFAMLIGPLNFTTFERSVARPLLQFYGHFALSLALTTVTEKLTSHLESTSGPFRCFKFPLEERLRVCRLLRPLFL